MSEKSRFELKMDVLKKVSSISHDNLDKLLETFSFFVWSFRPDYCYNETYLCDFIPKFGEIMDSYKRKQEFVDSLQEHLNSLNLFNINKLIIVIDNIWTKEYSDGSWKEGYLATGSLDLLAEKKRLFVELIIEVENIKIIEDYLDITMKQEQNELVERIKQFLRMIEKEKVYDQYKAI